MPLCPIECPGDIGSGGTGGGGGGGGRGGGGDRSALSRAIDRSRAAEEPVKRFFWHSTKKKGKAGFSPRKKPGKEPFSWTPFFFRSDVGKPSKYKVKKYYWWTKKNRKDVTYSAHAKPPKKTVFFWYPDFS